jgi:tetratricopeptide (TPR) repeat protein
MRHRTWDFYLPFFAGFNAAYFLKDFESAARYYQRAGELTGDDLFMKLAGRYLYETGATEQAIAYLTMMVQGANNDAVRASLATRLETFKGVRIIEQARDRFLQATGKLPKDLTALRQGGFLPTLPRDPYGGTFFITANGSVRSTSNFAPTAVEKDKKE